MEKTNHRFEREGRRGHMRLKPLSAMTALDSRSTWAEPKTALSRNRVVEVVIVGAGAAGIGCGVVLKDLGIENFLTLPMPKALKD